MSDIVDINGKKYQINVDVAIEKGILREVITDFSAGDVWQSKTGLPCVIIKKIDKYAFAGFKGNPSDIYVSIDAMDKDQMIGYLSEHRMTKVGKVEMPILKQP